MNHIIYKTTNLLNGRFYIGMHSTRNIDDGYLGSGDRIRNEIQKYGQENFKREILEVHSSRDLLKIREAELVNEILLANPLCLNIAPGGGGGLYSAEHAAKFQAGAVEATRKRIREHGQPQKCLDVLVPLTDRTRCDWNGRTHSDETKSKIGEKNKCMTGEKNSQFGTCWITNGTPVKIKKEQLDEYLAKGYVRGRRVF